MKNILGEYMKKMKKSLFIWFKNNSIYIVLVLLFLLSLFLPLLLFEILVHSKEWKDMVNSIDVLGYYGSVLGGLVTVIGIILTFNYERKKTKEELRENNLPLLRFSYQPNDFDANSSKSYEIAVSSGITKVFSDWEDSRRALENIAKLSKEAVNQQNIYQQQINHYITREQIIKDNYGQKSEEYLEELTYCNKAYSILSSRNQKLQNDILNSVSNTKAIADKINITNGGNLKIENIGLQTAIISSIALVKYDGTSSFNTEILELDRFAVPKNSEIKLKLFISIYDYYGFDFLLVEFKDLYSNRYVYNVPFELKKIQGMNALIINPNSIPVLPRHIE